MKKLNQKFTVGQTRSGKLMTIHIHYNKEQKMSFLLSFEISERADLFCAFYYLSRGPSKNRAPTDLIEAIRSYFNLLWEDYSEGNFTGTFSELGIQNKDQLLKHGESLCFENFSYSNYRNGI